MKHTLLIKDWLYSFLSLWFPRCCVVCGGSLAKGEECICTMCNINLPRTDYHLRKDNPVKNSFGVSFLWNVPLLFSFIAKEVIFGKFSTNSNMEDRKKLVLLWDDIWHPNCRLPISFMELM